MKIDRSHSAPDRRVGRTQQLLIDALLELVQEKRYDKITVQDILDRANVGRSTFYAHFHDKDDLLTGNFANVAAEEIFAGQDELNAVEENNPEQMVVPMLPLLQHARDHYHLYEALKGTDGIKPILENLRKNLQSVLATRVQELRPDLDDGQQQLALHFLCEGLIAATLYWLENDSTVPAEEVDAQLQRLMRNGLSR